MNRQEAIEVISQDIPCEYDTDLIEALNMAIEALQDDWVPVSERLPNEKEVVLITNDKSNVRFGQFRGTHGKYWIWKGNTLETVLAWLPLPKPYEEREE